MWGHSKQVTVWVAHNGSDQEAAPSDFALAKKPSAFDFAPHPAWGTHTPTRWSLAWGTLTCPLPHARNCTSLAHCGATWWEGKVGPHQPKLWTGPGGWKGHCSKLPSAPPHCLGRWPLHPPWLTFQGSGALANTPGVATSTLGLISAKLAGDLPHTKGAPLLKTASGWHCPPWSSTARSKCVKSHPELPAMHHPCEPGGAVLLCPLSEIPLKNERWLIFSKITGDLPQVVGKCALKMGSGYLLPPWSSTTWSKCAKSHQKWPYPWYGILTKRGTPLSKFQIRFLAPISSSREVRTVVWRCAHNY